MLCSELQRIGWGCCERRRLLAPSQQSHRTRAGAEVLWKTSRFSVGVVWVAVDNLLQIRPRPYLLCSPCLNKGSYSRPNAGKPELFRQQCALGKELQCFLGESLIHHLSACLDKKRVIFLLDTKARRGGCFWLDLSTSRDVLEPSGEGKLHRNRNIFTLQMIVASRLLLVWRLCKHTFQNKIKQTVPRRLLISHFAQYSIRITM